MANRYISSSTATFTGATNLAASAGLGFAEDGSATTGWTGYTGASTSVPGAVSATGGKLRVTNSTAAAHRGVATMAGLTAGKIYKITYDFYTPNTNGGTARVASTATSTVGNFFLTQAINAVEQTGQFFYFTASATTMYFIVAISSASSSHILEVDNVIVQEAGDGSTWANAWPTVLTATDTANVANLVAGDDIWIAHDHSETITVTVVLTFPGTPTSPNRILCITNGAAATEANLTTGAFVNLSGNFGLSLAGCFYCYGVKFSGGTTANSTLNFASAPPSQQVYKKCTFHHTGGNVGGLVLGTATTLNRASIVWDECSLDFGSTANGIRRASTDFKWINTPDPFVGAQIPTTLFNPPAIAGTVLVEGVNFEDMVTGKTLVGNHTSANTFIFKDCKLGSGATVAAAQTDHASARVFLINCDSGDTNYRNERHSYEGTGTTETVIVRTGGGTYSRKLTTGAGASFIYPYEAAPIQFWNTTTGSAITVTLEGVWDNASLPDNDEIWLEAEYLGTSGFPQGSFISDGMATILSTPAAQTTSSVTWTTTGLTTPTKFKIAVTFTPQEAGPVALYVKVALASVTFYIDPTPVVT